MGVYYRTGRNSGASFPWWFWMLVIAPIQVACYMIIGLIWIVVVFVRLTLIAATAAHSIYDHRNT